MWPLLGLAACYSVILIIFGSVYVDKAIRLDDFVEEATYEPCNVTYVEKVDCSSTVRATTTTKQYYVYEAYSESCGDQILDYNEDFKICKKGTSHRKDVGEHNCYVVDCDEFVFGSTEKYIKKWQDGGIVMLVFGLLPCELPVLAGILCLIYLFFALCVHCYQKVRDWCQRKCPCNKVRRCSCNIDICCRKVRDRCPKICDYDDVDPDDPDPHHDDSAGAHSDDDVDGTCNTTKECTRPTAGQRVLRALDNMSS